MLIHLRGPFSATGTYTDTPECKLKCKRRTPCNIQSLNIEKFAIEENDEVHPPSVKIYFEGRMAWYEITSPHKSYASIFAEMQLKAQIWLSIQFHRSENVIRYQTKMRATWPTLKQLQRALPAHLQSYGDDAIDTFHPYLIERIIQSHLSGENLTVGPEGIMPRWMECQAVVELKNKYPVPTFRNWTDDRLCGNQYMIVLKRH